jgi:hypothetical protein
MTKITDEFQAAIAAVEARADRPRGSIAMIQAALAEVREQRLREGRPWMSAEELKIVADFEAQDKAVRDKQQAQARKEGRTDLFIGILTTVGALFLLYWAVKIGVSIINLVLSWLGIYD